LTTATANFNGTNTTLRTSRAGPTVADRRLPLEAVVGWDATQNGNMAELLQEPSLMGAFEGAASRCYPRAAVPGRSGTVRLSRPPRARSRSARCLNNAPRDAAELDILDAAGLRSNTSTAHKPYPSNSTATVVDRWLRSPTARRAAAVVFVHGWGMTSRSPTTASRQRRTLEAASTSAR